VEGGRALAGRGIQERRGERSRNLEESVGLLTGHGKGEIFLLHFYV
jgi:hypothetical protein